MFDYRPCPISTHVQNLRLNVPNLVYPTTLPNVFCKQLVFPLVSIPLIENVMEKNLVGFPNSMFFHVGPCTPYSGPCYGGKGGAPVMWLPIFDPLVNIMAPPKLILGVAQALIIIDHMELLDEDDDSSKKKHNPRMPQIVPINERRGRPSLIRDGVGLPPGDGTYLKAMVLADLSALVIVVLQEVAVAIF
jgi:hypothetical protein